MRCIKFKPWLIAAIWVILTVPATAATLTVTKTADTNDGNCNSDCSLREAIVRANQTAPSDTIVFSSLFNTAQTITLALGALPIDTTMVINGPGARLLTISSNGSDRILTISSTGALSIFSVAIRNGQATTGGGIYNEGNCVIALALIADNVATDEGGGGIRSSGTLQIDSSTISGNAASAAVGVAGGGIEISGGDARISNSTISGNTATGASNSTGGGIAILSALSTVYLNNVTIANNEASTHGGGISLISPATVFMRNSIVANNQTTDASSNDVDHVVGTWVITSDGHNLVEDPATDIGFTNGVDGDIVGSDPVIGPLQDNGGPTDTHALQFGSPAIEAGDNCVADFNCTGPNIAVSVDDQRGPGFPRRIFANVDIGAVEFNFTTAAEASVAGRVTNGSVPLNGVWVVLVERDGIAHYARTNAFGYFSFSSIPTGQTVVVTAYAKGYSFLPQYLNLDEDVDGLELASGGR